MDEQVERTLAALDAIVWVLDARHQSLRHRAIAAQIARSAAQDLRRPRLVSPDSASCRTPEKT